MVSGKGAGVANSRRSLAFLKCSLCGLQGPTKWRNYAGAGIVLALELVGAEMRVSTLTDLEVLAKGTVARARHVGLNENYYTPGSC